MMESQKVKTVYEIFLNTFIICLGIYGTVIGYFNDGLGVFIYYTVLSNIFGALTSALLVFYLIRHLQNGKDVPEIAHQLKYMSVCCLTVTFLVVLFVLAPARENGYVTMFLQEGSFCHHLMCPILSFIYFICFERVYLSPIKSALLATIPTVLYGLVTVILNAARVMEGPYFFLYVHNQPLYMTIFWIFAIIGGSFVISFLLATVKRPIKTGENK